MEFILVASAHFLALLSPGPDFFLIGQTALRYPLRSALTLISGISLANAIYLILAISGTELFKQSAQLFTILQYFGGGYLLYLGIMLLLSPRQQGILVAEKTEKKHLHTFFIRGFLNGILNPKNMIFYFSIFTVMVSESTGFGMRILYGSWMVFLVFSWDLLVAKMIGHQRVKRHLGRSIFYIEKIAGTALATFGISLTLN